MPTHILRRFSPLVRMLILSASCVSASFLIGIETAGEYPVLVHEPVSAEMPAEREDIDVTNMIALFEILATSETNEQALMHSFDWNSDHVISFDDGIALLHSLSSPGL